MVNIMIYIIILILVILLIVIYFTSSTQEGFGLLDPRQYGINDPTGGLRQYSNLIMQNNWDNNWNYPGFLRSFPGYSDYLYVDLIDPTFKRDMYLNELNKFYPSANPGELPGSGKPVFITNPSIYPSLPIVADQTLPTPLETRYLSRYSSDPSSPIQPGNPTLYTGDVPFSWDKVTYMPNIQPNLSSEIPHMYKTSEYCVNQRLKNNEGSAYQWETLGSAISKCTV